MAGLTKIIATRTDPTIKIENSLNNSSDKQMLNKSRETSKQYAEFIIKTFPYFSGLAVYSCEKANPKSQSSRTNGKKISFFYNHEEEEITIYL